MEPSGLNAAAMVERGGGVSSQYVAAQRRRKSHSAKLPSRCRGSASTGSTGASRPDADGVSCSTANRRVSAPVNHMHAALISFAASLQHRPVLPARLLTAVYQP